jgi:aldose sugar dehydrogenase
MATPAFGSGRGRDACPPIRHERGPRNTTAGTINVETVATGLAHPWGLAFLPDGRMLVTERSGTLRLVSKDGKLSEPLSGVPEVVAEGQGGLLDVAIDPDFKSNGLVYLTYSEPGEGGALTAVARGKLGNSGLENVEVIFRQEPKINGNLHFRLTSRIRSRRHAVCHTWRARSIHPGAGPF